jgi:hypothetical protein
MNKEEQMKSLFKAMVEKSKTDPATAYFMWKVLKPEWFQKAPKPKKRIKKKKKS